MAGSTRSTVARRLALFVTVGLLVLLLPGLRVPVTDFSAFWFAGTALVHGQNPYDPQAALALQRAAGMNADIPWVMRNPPSALFLTLPLGFFPYTWAWLVWTALLVGAIAYSSTLLWKLYGGDVSPDKRWIPWLISFAFAPVLACLSVGQLAPVVLLGIALLLTLESRHGFWAGASLVLITVKPQLTYLFLAALFCWLIERRRWRLMVGAVFGFCVAGAIALALERSVFVQYWHTFSNGGVTVQFIPTLGGTLRRMFGRDWLQLLPAGAGIVWFICYYARHHRHWDWRERTPMLLLVSMLSTPYAFLIDELVLLPAFLCAAVRLQQSGHRERGLVAAFLAVNAMILIMLTSGMRVVSLAYVWTPTAWLLFYVAAQSRTAASKMAIAAG